MVKLLALPGADEASEMEQDSEDEAQAIDALMQSARWILHTAAL